MTLRRFSVLAFAAFVSICAAGCATDFVEDAARSSLSSFVVSVFSTAANDAISP